MPISQYPSFEECISDLISDPNVLEMRDIQQHVNINCLDHCIYVAYLSYRICRFFKLDFIAAARGGLLHDLFLYNWREKNSHKGLHGFTHPAAALDNASRLFELTDKEKDIISKHMWPLTLRKIPRYRESFVVCSADKLCAVAEMLHIYHAMHMGKKLQLPA